MTYLTERAVDDRCCGTVIVSEEQWCTGDQTEEEQTADHDEQPEENWVFSIADCRLSISDFQFNYTV